HLLEVRREADAVRTAHRPLGDDADLARVAVDAVYAGGQLELRLVPFVRSENAVARIGEPDRAVRMNGGVVRRVEFLAFPVVHQDGPGTVIFAAAHAAGVVLARDQPPLVVAGVAVGIAGLGLVHAHVAVVLRPAQRPVVGDVAPDQAAPVAHPDRPFAPQRAVAAHAVPDALQRRV